jgi:hypothetical protein
MARDTGGGRREAQEKEGGGTLTVVEQIGTAMAATAAHARARRRQAKPGHGDTTAPPAPRRRSQGGVQAPGAPGTAGSSGSRNPSTRRGRDREQQVARVRSTRIGLTAVVWRVDCAPWRGPSPANLAGIERRRRRRHGSPEQVRVRVRSRVRRRERSGAGRAGPGRSVRPNPLGCTDRWAQGCFCLFTNK